MVSDFLKTVTVVQGIPQKTEWNSGNLTSTKTYNNSTKTTLTDAENLSGAHYYNFSFFHSPDAASCGITPRMGSKKWFVLDKDKTGHFRYSLCTATRVPMGAILDYHLNGTDAEVPNKSMCYFFQTQKQIDKFDKSRANEADNKLVEMNCEFWDKNNQNRLNKLLRDYEIKQYRKSKARSDEK